MLYVIIGEQKGDRAGSVGRIVSQFPDSDILVLDDTMCTITDLEQYIYPSLFSAAVPIVHTKFIMDGKAGEMNAERIKKLHASPTIFICEEFFLPATVLTLLKKHAVEIYSAKKAEKTKTPSTIFSVTNALTLGDKKSRWFAYQDAIAEHPIEAVLGILYWKIRDLIIKGGKDQERYKNLYTALITAHKNAWLNGTSLELAIEKVILEE